MTEREAVLVDGVHKSFGTVEVLRGVDLALADHEVVCLIGASGSGKSTLLRCINLLEPIDAGRIVVEGQEITARGVDVNEVRRHIGIVFQAYNLFPHMSVLRNVTLAPRLAADKSRAEAEAEATALLELAGVTKRFGHHTVLDGVDLAVDEHEVVCLIGASGSGKSTLLRCVNLLEPIDGGRILEEAPPEQIFTAPEQERTRAFLSRVLEAGRL